MPYKSSKRWLDKENSMGRFRGCGVAITTPMDEFKLIDYDTLEKHIEFLIENNADAIIPCGTTGESATLSFEEKLEVTKFVVEQVAGRVPVIGGSGGNSTSKVIELSLAMQNAGVDGLLIVTPFYNKTTQSGLYHHYKDIADAVELPIILYNVPSRTGLNMLPETVAKLAEIDNITGIKEASADISQIAEVARLCPDLDLFAGNDDQILPILSLGGIGVITSVGNIIPNAVHELVFSYFERDIAKSRELQLDMLPLIHAIFSEVNPIPVKKALEYMGFGESNTRPPLYTMEEENRKKLKKEMKAYGIL